MGEPNYYEETHSASQKVLHSLEQAQDLQLNGQLPEAVQIIENALQRHEEEGNASNVRVTWARSNLASLLDQIGHSDRALDVLSTARQEWNAFPGEARIFGHALCAQTETSALRKLGKYRDALRAGQLTLKLYRAWLAHKSDLEPKDEKKTVDNEDALKLIQDVTSCLPRSTLGFEDLTSTVAIFLVSHFRIIADIYVQRGDFESARQWLQTLYQAVAHFSREQKLLPLAITAQGYETLLFAASERKNGSSEDAEDTEDSIVLASARLQELVAAIEHWTALAPQGELIHAAPDDAEPDPHETASLDPEVMLALNEANRLHEAGEFSECLAELMKAIFFQEAKHGESFCLEVALAKTKAGAVMCDLQLPEQALDFLGPVDRDWEKYEGEDCLMHFAASCLVQARALLQLNQFEEVKAESQNVLKLLAAWLHSQSDPQAALHGPDFRASEAAEILWEALSQTVAWAPEDSAGIIGMLAHSCACIARAQISSGRLLSALPWLDEIYERLDRLSEFQKPAVRHALFLGYCDLELSAFLCMDQEQWRTQWSTELEWSLLERAVERSNKLSDSLELLRGSQRGQMGLHTRMRNALQISPPDRAHAKLVTILAELDSSKQPRYRAMVLMHIAELDTTMDHFGEAIHKLNNAISLIAGDPSGDPLRARCQLELARACLKQKDFATGLRWCYASLYEMREAFGSDFTAYKRASLIAAIAGPMFLIGKALHGMNNRSASIFFLKLGMAHGRPAMEKMVERLLPLVARQVAEYTMETTREILAERLIEGGRLGEALSLAIVKDFAGDTEADRVPMTPAEREGVSQFVSGLEALWPSSAEKVQALVESVAEKLRTAQAAESDESSVFDRQQLSRFMDALPWDPSTAYLRYTPLADHLQIVVVTSQGTEARSTQISAGELAKSSFQFLESLANQNNFTIESLAQGLYGHLVAPVRDVLEKVQALRLIIDARGLLRFIPFSALHDGERYLVERFSCVSWEPAVAGVLKQHPSPQPRLSLLGRLTGDEERGIAALPSVQDEFANIIATCRAGEKALLREPPMLDDLFTAASLQEALANSNIVHISTHFYNNPADHRGSRLVLGGEELLGLDDLGTLNNGRAKIDLVMLSACSTGVPAPGLENASEMSPAAVLHAMGVRSVVTTLWPIVSASTAQLMDVFYRGLIGRECTDKADTLRIAQLSLLHGTTGLPLDSDHDLTGFGVSHYDQGGHPAEAPDYSHPYFWAPFILSGNWLPFADKP
jgi:CHAT domain-containing protein/predicted negative regulator of RcsB-dependent stress response